VVNRLQQLLSPGKLSLEDKSKLARASGRARTVVLAEFPWVSASQLTQWNKPAARKQLTDRLQGCTRAGGRGRRSARKIKGWGGRKPEWDAMERVLFDNIKSKRGKGIKVRAKFVKAEARRLLNLPSDISKGYELLSLRWLCWGSFASLASENKTWFWLLASRANTQLQRALPFV
jgi:hypothetical protein